VVDSAGHIIAFLGEQPGLIAPISPARRKRDKEAEARTRV
jgi:hypothetical protein